jgi:Transglycosylase SLT domain
VRLILALAIFLLGMGNATPEPKVQDRLFASSTTLVASNAIPSIANADRALVHAFAPAAPLFDRAPEFAMAVPFDVSPGDGAGFGVQLQSSEMASKDVFPSLDDVCSDLFASAEINDLPVPFFANLIWQESGLQDDAISRVGAIGIAQFMPEVAVEIGLADPFDPRQAIPASAKFLHTLRQQFGNLGFVAAAYNAGASRVIEWLVHGAKLPRETQIYVARVTGRSVDQWRAAPPDDSALAFVRQLPCRDRPDFADLEQAQFPELQQLQQAQAQQERAVKEVEKTLSAIYRRVAARRHARVVRRPQPAPAVIGNVVQRPQPAPAVIGNVVSIQRPQPAPTVIGNVVGIRPGAVRSLIIIRSAPPAIVTTQRREVTHRNYPRVLREKRRTV